MSVRGHSEFKYAPKMADHLSYMGWKVRKVEEKSGGLPDYLCAKGGLNFLWEAKVVDEGPPWTMAKLTLRRSQGTFFRTWPGLAAMAAFVVNKEMAGGGYWVIGASPDHMHWERFDEWGAAAFALSCIGHNKLPPRRTRPWLLPVGQG